MQSYYTSVAHGMSRLPIWEAGTLHDDVITLHANLFTMRGIGGHGDFDIATERTASPRFNENDFYPMKVAVSGSLACRRTPF
jgi:hypothetical protein